MNKPDTSNNRAGMETLNSDNSLQLEQSSCPFYSIMPSDNMRNTQLPSLKPAGEPQPEIQNPELPQDTADSDWVVEPNSQQQTIVDSEFKQLLALNQELRGANNQLYEEVEHLKDDLAESEKALQWHKRRSSVAESMLNQQNKELAAAQEQIKSLFQELETAVQTVQRQENFIETYKAQLQTSQQRLAQLERECAMLQTNYNEQSQQASQSENTCRELRSRLMRQQRQTLQFKAALEKCLETPGVNNCSEDILNQETRFSRKARSLFPDVQPIKPWSAESEPHGCQVDYPENKFMPLCGEEQESPINSSDNSQPVPSSDSQSTASVEPSKLDSQLDGLIQRFFNMDSAAASLPPAKIDDVESDETEAPVGETKTTSFENNQPLEIPDGEEDSPISVTNHSPESLNLSGGQTNGETSLTAGVAWGGYAEDYAKNTQSPSPVVYPQRPPKGRKSLSSVELPNFRTNNQYTNPQ
jgi:myosin heavy subunit